MMKKAILFISCLAFWSSCYYDNASEMYPAAALNQNCDTLDVTYSVHLAPLFRANCGTNNSCHSTAYSEAGVVLDNYTGAAAVDEVKLLGCIEQLDGFQPMPPTGKMSDCGITQIKIWIQNGKPQ